MTDPFIPADLEELRNKDDTQSLAKLLYSLARQLGVTNDFYFPLLSAAKHLELE
jgi:hypothetical protein